MKHKLRIILIALVFWLGAILAINKLSNYFIPNRTSYEVPYQLNVERRSVVLPFLNFDGRNYLDIAYKGYFQKGEYNLRAFFPLYPLLIRGVSQITSINVIYSGLLVSFAAFIGSIYMLYRIVSEEFGHKKALKAILLLLLFPTSFYLISYYAESLFLLLTLLVFWFLNKKKFALATLFAALASSLRIVGVVLGMVVIYEAIKQYKENKQFPWVTLFSPMGLVSYSLYSYISVGDPLIYLHSWTVWEKTFSPFGPINAVISGIKNLIAGPLIFFDSPFVYPVSVIEFLSAIFLVGFLIASFKKIKTIYWLYLLASSYFYLAGGILQSLPRYLLVLFPIHIFVATRLNKTWFSVYVLVSAILFVFLSAIFLKGYWVS